MRKLLLPKTKIEISFVDEKEIARLNKQFLHRDGPTDVLSFNLDEKLPDGTYYLGDVIICLPIAEKQARELGHSLEEEIGELTKHGVMHLMGWEHK